MSERGSLSWDPISDGPTYCAPACGSRCTRAAYDRAEACAGLLARTLGPGWIPRVWENLGWHYSVRSPCGRLMVHPSSVDGFTAFLGPVGGIGGRWAEHGDTPQKAIDATVAVAVAEYNEIATMIKGLESGK